MEARKVQIDTLFEPRVQYRIPLFQRHYVWDEKNQWIPLWKDIHNNYVHIQSQTKGKSSIHFTGAIVIQQQQDGMFAAGDVPIYDIIDGQQRLTTFQIIFCAIRDICEENGHDDIASDVNLYLVNQGKMLGEDEQYKLIPTVHDRDTFLSLIDKRGDENQGKIQDAYNYFKKTIIDEVKGDSEKLFTLFSVIRKNVGFAQIQIDEDDHPDSLIFLIFSLPAIPGSIPNRMSCEKMECKQRAARHICNRTKKTPADQTQPRIRKTAQHTPLPILLYFLYSLYYLRKCLPFSMYRSSGVGAKCQCGAP